MFGSHFILDLKWRRYNWHFPKRHKSKSNTNLQVAEICTRYKPFPPRKHQATNYKEREDLQRRRSGRSWRNNQKIAHRWYLLQSRSCKILKWYPRTKGEWLSSRIQFPSTATESSQRECRDRQGRDAWAIVMLCPVIWWKIMRGEQDMLLGIEIRSRKQWLRISEEWNVFEFIPPMKAVAASQLEYSRGRQKIRKTRRIKLPDKHYLLKVRIWSRPVGQLRWHSDRQHRQLTRLPLVDRPMNQEHLM